MQDISLTLNDEVDTQFAKILEAVKKLNPEVHDRLRAKYVEDHEAFLHYVKSNTKSTNPRDWSKQDCNNCNSKGIIFYTDGRQSICSCASKKYIKWVKTLRTQFKGDK